MRLNLSGARRAARANRPQERVEYAAHAMSVAMLCLSLIAPLFSLRAECCAKRSIARQNSTPCRRVDAHHKVSRCAKIHSLPHAEAARRRNKALQRTPGYVSRKSRIAYPMLPQYASHDAAMISALGGKFIKFFKFKRRWACEG